MTNVHSIKGAKRSAITAIGGKSAKAETAAEVKVDTVKKKAAPKTVETATETAVKAVVSNKKLKTIVLDLKDPKKNSVVYANDLGQSIYLRNEYLTDAKSPPAQIKLTVEEIR